VEVAPVREEDDQYRLAVKALERSSITTGWLLSSVRVAGPAPTAVVMPFYADWLTRTHRHGEDPIGLRPDMRLVIVLANSTEERVARASAVDEVEAGNLRGYLEPYNAQTASYTRVLLQDNGSTSFGSVAIAYRLNRGFLYTKHESTGKVSGYIARVSPPADAFAELAYEIVIDGTDHVAVATYIDLPRRANDLRLSLDDDRLLATSLRLLGRAATLLAEIPYPIVVRGEPADEYAARAVVKERFDHFAVADIEDIQLELVYHDPRHYPEPRIFSWSVMKVAEWSPGMPRIELSGADSLERPLSLRESLRTQFRRLGDRN
jgi:hypothetical protein